MYLNLIFHIYDFHNLKIVNNIFFFISERSLIFLSRGVQSYFIFNLIFKSFSKKLILRYLKDAEGGY